MKSYCPNCVELLKRQSKKLGKLSSWYICPKCGYRTREMSEFYDEKRQLEEFEEGKSRINNKWKNEENN